MSRIAIVGSGSWGTALAVSLARRGGHSICLWSHSAAVVETIEKQRENLIYLPGHRISEQISVTTEIGSAVEDAEIAILAVPAQHLRETCQAMAASFRSSQVLVSAAKGIENATSLRMTEVIAEVSHMSGQGGPSLAVLSGPSFAQEVAAGFPTAITVAAEDSRLATHLQEELSGPGLRLYTNDDIVGVEIGGALKNVIAIAAGTSTGIGLGHNSVAAIITRGIAEITRLAIACGGRRQTLAGLSGLGDLVLTCTGPLSRNRQVGIGLGRGGHLPEILEQLGGKVAEGVRTASATLGLALRRGVEMPITEQVNEILDGEKSPQDAIRALMTRPGREE